MAGIWRGTFPVSLLRSSFTVGGFTLLSLILGFARDVGMAALLGAGPVAEAFVIAFRLPNLFRRFFGEGAFNAAFVPLFSKRLQGEGRAAARIFAERALAGLLIILLPLTLLAELFMPAVVLALAPGFAADEEKFQLAVLLARITFPYLLCMSVVALLGGVLNSMQRFAAAAATPVMLNVVFIAALAIAWMLGLNGQPQTGVLLAIAVALAGLAQLVLLWVAATRAGFSLRLRRPVWSPDMRRLVRLGVPGLIAGGITQLNLVISTIIASWQEGAPAWLYYADRIYQLPLGLVGIAIGIVLLPDISRKLRAGDSAGVDESQNRALEFAMFLTIPAAVALMAMPHAIVEVLFERGRFTEADTRATAAALAAFAAGLPAFVLIKVFSPAFFAREDTRTPMRFAAFSMPVNIALALALFPFIGHVGIALATTAASWINALMLAAALSRRGLWRPDARVRRQLPRMTLLALFMGVCLLALQWAWHAWEISQASFAWRLGALAVMIALGAALYLVPAMKLGLFSPATLRRALRRPAPRKETSP